MRFVLANIEKIITILLTSAMTFVLFLQVFSRYVFNLSISWSEELSIFCLVWLTYFGAALAVKQRRHLRIEVFVSFLSPKKRKIIDILCNVVFFCFCLFLVYGTYNMTMLAKATGQTAAATGLKRWLVFAGLPVSFLLVAIRLLQDMARQFREYRLMDEFGVIPGEAGKFQRPEF
ncbi:TRAP transporter small permease [Aminiphilus circumscriptus]|uniref:TRAP transporter small permease n=1 Tax=Aminiphilus circumscriptus TaxID=290732 RepID=UPI0004785EE3|nr:TRAP transporter small permease [Aminiphilus circumscriptus]